MELVAGSLPQRVRRLAVLAGAFNPPTVAHEAILAAARGAADAALCVVPREYPHKRFHGATFEERIAMLRALGHPVAVTEGGLFLDIAREMRGALPGVDRVLFACGRDAAERIAAWDYGQRESFEVQLREFGLLVAARCGEFAGYRSGIEPLALAEDFDEISSTAIRESLASGGAKWRTWVPERIHEMAETIYGTMRER